jgi:hypothetical protein
MDQIGRSEKRLRLKIELVKRDWRHRDLAARLRERGFEVDTDDVSRLVAGRWTPPSDVREAIVEILECPSFELFA